MEIAEINDILERLERLEVAKAESAQLRARHERLRWLREQVAARSAHVHAEGERLDDEIGQSLAWGQAAQARTAAAETDRENAAAAAQLYAAEMAELEALREQLALPALGGWIRHCQTGERGTAILRVRRVVMTRRLVLRDWRLRPSWHRASRR